MFSLSAEDKLLLAVVFVHPTDHQLFAINELLLQIKDWERIKIFLTLHGLAPLFYSHIKQLENNYLVPKSVKAHLRQVYFKTLTRTVVLQNAFNSVAEVLQEKGIKVIALKGIYLAEHLYGDIGSRQFSDIDLLVKPEDGLACIQVLNELGYHSVKEVVVSEFIQAKSNKVHYAPMVLNGISVEIHTRLHRINESYQMNLKKCWNDAVPVLIQGVPSLRLSDHDLLIHLCLHLDKHFKEGHVQFTCFMDITNYLENFVDQFNWEEFVALCRQYKSENEVFKYLVMCHYFFYAAVPEGLVVKYIYLLTNDDKSIFIQYLNGHTFELKASSAIPTHLDNLKRIQSVAESLRYIKDVIFPPKIFMLQKYLNKRKKNKLLVKFWWIWYPYRWLVGIVGLIRLMIRRL